LCILPCASNDAEPTSGGGLADACRCSNFSHLVWWSCAALCRILCDQIRTEKKPIRVSHARRCGTHSHPYWPPAFPTLNLSHAPQRRREHEALFTLDGWDVELVEDEQWGRVLVAQRDFAAGEIVIRSHDLLFAHSAAECVRRHRAYAQDGSEFAAGISQYMAWSKTSPW
jgi:hypothetical protein